MVVRGSAPSSFSQRGGGAFISITYKQPRFQHRTQTRTFPQGRAKVRAWERGCTYKEPELETSICDEEHPIYRYSVANQQRRLRIK
jgi:hypothetical protein